MIDFGEAEFYDEEKGNQKIYGNSIWGNKYYIPPEVSKEIKNLEVNRTRYATLKYEKCDIWSSSAMLYNFISPFNLDNTNEFSLENINPLPETLSSLQKIFNKTLEPDPYNRYDAKEVLEKLRNI